MNLEVMSSLEVPVIAVVIGEGGSGGALALGVANRLLMLENSIYSVISPESCSAILYRDPTKAQKSADALKLTAQGSRRLRDHRRADRRGARAAPTAIPPLTAKNVGDAIRRHLAELKQLSPEQLVTDCYRKFRAMGVFTVEE